MVKLHKHRCGQCRCKFESIELLRSHTITEHNTRFHVKTDLGIITK